jgi:glycosyltransferase involved in cell wall biosynthesis
VRAATGYVVRRAQAVIAVSAWLRDRLEAAVPDAIGKTEVVSCGVDLARFAPRDPFEARAEVGWPDGDGTAYLCLGSLTERKNVLRLARAFERRGEGTLTFVGDGPLRAALEGRGHRLAGRVRHDEVPFWIAAADVVCQPSLVEPFGLSTLEAMASARAVVGTRVGGPPEFVPPEAGILVDPEDEDRLVLALEAAAALPRPNLAARAAAELHDVKLQAARVEEILERHARRSSRDRHRR